MRLRLHTTAIAISSAPPTGKLQFTERNCGSGSNIGDDFGLTTPILIRSASTGKLQFFPFLYLESQRKPAAPTPTLGLLVLSHTYFNNECTNRKIAVLSVSKFGVRENTCGSGSNIMTALAPTLGRLWHCYFNNECTDGKIAVSVHFYIWSHRENLWLRLQY